jgi:hypothetical protein
LPFSAPFHQAAKSAVAHLIATPHQHLEELLRAFQKAEIEANVVKELMSIRHQHKAIKEILNKEIITFSYFLENFLASEAF